MEQFDPGVERRVWQRVGRDPQPQREDLRGLLAAAREAAADYRFLSVHLTGPAGDTAKRLYETAQDTAACLRGLQQLRGSPAGRSENLPQVQGNAQRVLARSYHRARNMAGEYLARSVDGECGGVFRELARREEEACWRIAGLMGR